MKWGRVAAVSLLVAASLFLGVTLPARRDAEAAADEFGRIRRERQDVRKRLLPLERREENRKRAEVILASSSSGPAESLTEMRRMVVASLEGFRVSNLRFQVRPGTSPVRMSVQLSAEGPFPELVRLSGHLVRGGSGLILDRVRFTPATAGLRLEVDAIHLESSR